jgi:hypothetical protein
MLVGFLLVIGAEGLKYVNALAGHNVQEQSNGKDTPAAPTRASARGRETTAASNAPAVAVRCPRGRADQSVHKR